MDDLLELIGSIPLPLLLLLLLLLSLSLIIIITIIVVVVVIKFIQSILYPYIFLSKGLLTGWS